MPVLDFRNFFFVKFYSVWLSLCLFLSRDPVGKRCFHTNVLIPRIFSFNVCNLWINHTLSYHIISRREQIRSEWYPRLPESLSLRHRPQKLFCRFRGGPSARPTHLTLIHHRFISARPETTPAVWQQPHDNHPVSARFISCSHITVVHEHTAVIAGIIETFCWDAEYSAKR